MSLVGIFYSTAPNVLVLCGGTNCPRHSPRSAYPLVLKISFGCTKNIAEKAFILGLRAAEALKRKTIKVG